jgi:serine O-acetyltransferase
MAETTQRNEVAQEPARNQLQVKFSHLEAFKADLDKYYRVLLGTPTPPLKQKARLWLSHLGLHCVAAYRLDRYSQSLRTERPLLGYALSVAGIAARMASEVVHHVGISAEIGPGLFIGHAGNIYIGPTRIGRNFSVTHNVTVGVGHNRGERGIPVIGDDVWVGTGSVIAGAIRIGNRATVTHGSLITRDVPDEALAGGNPGRVISHNYDNGRLMGEEQVTELRRGPAQPVQPAAS